MVRLTEVAAKRAADPERDWQSGRTLKQLQHDFNARAGQTTIPRSCTYRTASNPHFAIYHLVANGPFRLAISP